MPTETLVTADMLRVRNERNEFVPLTAAEPFSFYQREYEKNAGKRNIVWKRRQVGMTTWAIAKAFLAACAGKDTVISIVHNQNSADYCFQMIVGFVAHLPKNLLPIQWWSEREHSFGLEGKSRSQFKIGDARFGGAGLSRMIDFLHFGEFAWWTETQQRNWLLSCSPCLRLDAELIIESTPPDKDGGTGLFGELWRSAEERGFVRHYFPWFKDPRYVAEAADEGTYSQEETNLALIHGMTPEQIGWRRKAMNNLNYSPEQFKVEYGESNAV